MSQSDADTVHTHSTHSTTPVHSTTPLHSTTTATTHTTLLSTLSSKLSSLLSYLPNSLSNTQNTNPTNSFLLHFQQRYGYTHPDFHQSSYNAALNLAKQNLSYFLPIITSHLHNDNDYFNRNILANNHFIQLVQQQNILVWAVDMAHSESLKVANLLNAAKFPFCALIAPQGSNMVVVLRIQGLTTINDLVAQLNRKISALAPSLDALRTQRQQQDANRQIIQQQDAAYHASLLADQEKERRAQAARNQQLQLARDAENAATLERAAQERAERTQSARREKRAKDVERAKLVWSTVAEPTNGTKLSIKLPTGERIVRTFSQHDTIDVRQSQLVLTPVRRCFRLS